MRAGIQSSNGGKGVKCLIKEILPMVSQRVATALENDNIMNLTTIEEIRLRADKPLLLHSYSNEWFIARDGSLTKEHHDAFVVTAADIMVSVELMSENSIYAYQEEIKNGYITIKGGHRVGLSGRVIADGVNIKSMKDISGLNIRISNQIPGCSRKVMRHIIKGKDDIFNTLIISPPQCGKTTILRDIARCLSDGMPEMDFKGIKVGIVDERSEIAACLRGIPQNDVGLRTDVLDSCPKRIGMPMLIRSMSPKVVITDEIGSDGDREAVHSVLNAGVRIVTSAHGYNVSELKSRREVLRMMEDKIFERYIVLSNFNGPGTLAEVIDGTNMKSVTGAGKCAV